MKKKLLKSMRALLVAAGLTTSLGASAYDTPDNYKVGTVYLGTEINNQVLAETFANCTNNTDLTSLSTNWSTNVGGTAGYYWAKIGNTVNTVAYPATNQATLYTCNEYSATNDGGETKTTIYSTDGVTYYTYKDLQTVFNTDGYEVTSSGKTDYQIPSYVYGKCISVQHRDKSAYYIDYTMPTAVSTGKLVFGADFYRIQNVTTPLYIQFFDSDDNQIFQIYYQNGKDRRNMYYQVGTNDAVSGAGYSEYRTYRGWGIKDMVFDLDDGTVSYTVDNVHWDGSHSPNRRKVSQSAIVFGTGKNIAKIRFYVESMSSNPGNRDFFIDNMYLYTLVSETATTSDMTFIGSKDYEDGYLASTSDDYVIAPNGKLHLQFKNYGSGAYNWDNWVALFDNSDKSSSLAYIRSDAWELVSTSNTGITTSSNYWDDFQTDLYGATVAMDITRTDGDVNMVATITTTTSKVLTLTFSKAIGTASEDIVFRLSEEAACLVLDNTKSVLAAPPTFTQTGITNTGNPVITVTGNVLTGNIAASYYTTDGSTPTTSSSAYSDPVTVTGGNTIKAITVATASDGTTTLTSEAGSLTATEYVAGQTYDLSATDAATIQAEGFTSSNSKINYGVGSTTRYGVPTAVGSEGKTILGGLTISGDSKGTWYYWMLGQGLWQSGGSRSATVTNTQDGEVALFTEYDCSYDGSDWSNTEVESYKSDCSYSLSQSKNAFTSGNHVHMLKTVQTFVPAGTTISANVTDAGYATFSSPYALDFTDNTDVTAYVATAVAQGTVTLTSVEKVPANTGLVLKSNNGGKVDATAIKVSGESIAAPATNYLKPGTGSAVAASTSSLYHYVFALQDGVVGFYNLSSDETVESGKAYLETTTDIKPASNNARVAIIFNDETMGIRSVQGESQKVNGGYYNLSGQRVSQLNKGLYIKSGKKILIK